MVSSTLILGLSAVAGALAAPAAHDYPMGPLEKRDNFNFLFGEDHPLAIARRNFTLARRSNTNYNQDYTTGGTVQFTPKTNGFSLNYNTQQDFVVGVGWNPGSTAPITLDGSWTVSSGLGSLSIYGWTTNPLVEYYIMEKEVNLSGIGTQKGTLTSDGSTYNILENTRYNEPSIQGTSTFNQYISVRQSARTSGTVTVANHFAAWKALGMNLGTMNFQVVAVESWSGSGSASMSVTNTGTGSTNPSGGTTTTTSKAPTGTASTGGGGGGNTGSCSAQWGQCGGIGWTGPTCCSSGTCKASNAYYSQCL